MTTAGTMETKTVHIPRMRTTMRTKRKKVKKKRILKTTLSTTSRPKKMMLSDSLTTTNSGIFMGQTLHIGTKDNHLEKSKSTKGEGR